MSNHLAHLPPSVEESLQRWAEHILEQDILGNKSHARATFRNIPDSRKGYVTMWMMFLAERQDKRDSVQTFIHTVTE